MGTLLSGKNAIIGGGIARTFAREGARVLLVGRTREALDEGARDVIADGGVPDATVPDATVLDATDESAVNEHEVTEVAALPASDPAVGMTGTMTNVTSGLMLR